MKPIVIKQTLEYTSGLFYGKKTVRFRVCYTEKELNLFRNVIINANLGSSVKLLDVEILK